MAVNAIGMQLRGLVKLGTDPMAVGSINKWTPPAGDILRVSPEFSLRVENKQADTGDGRTCFARSNSQERTRTREMPIFPVQLTTSRTGNLTRLIHTYLCYNM